MQPSSEIMYTMDVREPPLAVCYRMPPVAMPLGWHTLRRSFSAAERADGAYAFTSGQAALRWTLEVLAASTAARRRRKVIVPAYTCWSVAAAVEYADLRPVLVDVDPETLDFETGALEARLDSDTLAVIATHLFGRRPRLDRHAALARAAGAHLVEDAAQAQDPRASLEPGVTARITSTGRGKPLSTAGGGWLQLAAEAPTDAFAVNWRCLPEASAADGLRRAATALAIDALLHPRAFWLPARLPFLKLGTTHYPERIDSERASAFQRRLYATVAPEFEDVLAQRRAAARAYTAALAGASGPQPGCAACGDYAPHRFPVLLRRPWAEASRASRARAARAGVSAMYPRALGELDRVAARRADEGVSTPGAERLARQLVTLPTHAGAGPQERGRAIAAVEELGL